MSILHDRQRARLATKARALAIVLGIIAAAFSTACAAKARERTLSEAIQPKQDVAVNANQVRLRMRSLVDPLAGEIERAADQIASGASEPAVKRAAIRWKIEGVPALRTALFQPNPFTAVLDTWVFTNQMADYFEKGAGRAALGASAPLAVETCRRLEEEFAKVVATFTISGDVSKARAFARQWATDHPIRYAIQDRESTLSRVVERDVGVSWSIGEAVAEITTTVDDLHREIQIYSDHLFRQARWEAELLKVDLRAEEALPLAERAVKSAEQAVATLDRLAPAIEGAAGAASSAPTLVASERKAVIDALHTELTRTLTFLQNERIAGLQRISQERIAALQTVSEERIAALKDLREIAASERLALGREIEQAGVRLVDHAVWRVTQLLAATFVLLLLATVVFLFLVRKLFFSSRQPHL
jgi:hypothetical protein